MNDLNSNNCFKHPHERGMNHPLISFQIKSICRSVKIGEGQSEYGFHFSFDRELSGESP